jgi:hypothetical protein
MRWAADLLLFSSNGHFLFAEQQALRKIVIIHPILALILLLVNEINFSRLKLCV